MTQFSTELLNFLAQKQDIDEFFRTSLETAMNDPLQAELSALLGYEPYDKVGYNSGNSRNGNFSPALIPSYGRRDDHLEEMVIKLYQTGVRLEKLVISSSECMVITIVLPQFLISQKQLRRMSLLFMSES